MQDKPANNGPENLEERFQAMAMQEVCGSAKFTMKCPQCSSNARVVNTTIGQLGNRIRDHACKADGSHKWRTNNGEISDAKFNRGFSQKRDNERKERIEKILELASRPSGVSKEDVDISKSVIDRYFKDLMKSGQLHRMCGSGAVQGRNARYFANKEDGSKFFSKLNSVPDPLKIKYAKGPAFLDCEPDFSKAKVTICKSPEPSLRTNTHATF